MLRHQVSSEGDSTRLARYCASPRLLRPDRARAPSRGGLSIPSTGSAGSSGRARPLATAWAGRHWNHLASNASSTAVADVLFELGKERDQIPSGEAPLEWRGDLLVALEAEQTLLQVGQRGEIVGGKNLPLNDGEVDLDLIEPTGVNWGMDENCHGPLGSETSCSLLTAMTGAVIHDPEDARWGPVGLLAHGARGVSGARGVRVARWHVGLGAQRPVLR